jgi:hypothetical protein
VAAAVCCAGPAAAVSMLRSTSTGLMLPHVAPAAGVTMRRTATSPAALVTMDKNVVAREAPAQQGAAVITAHDAHSTFDYRKSADGELVTHSDAGPATR